MKTPDKIFVSSDPFGFISGYHMENHPPHGEEYIRKDALLEWAREEIELSKAVECVSEVSYEEGRQQVALNLIEKLNSM